MLSGWADRWIVDLFVVQIPSRFTWACGYVLRFLQLGNIQAYAFFWCGRRGPYLHPARAMSPLFCLIILPIAGAALTIAGTQARNTAITAAALNFLASLIIFGMCNPDGYFQFVSSFPWRAYARHSFHAGADGLSAAVLLLSTAVTLAAVCIARTPPKHGKLVLRESALYLGGGDRRFRFVDAFFFYMFHELALIPTFLLIGIWGRVTGRRLHGK